LIPLTTAVVLLGVIVALHVLLTFGLVTKIRELQQHGGGLPARDPDLPQPGLVVGSFSVTDVDGGEITEAELSGPARVGFFAAGCAPCTTLSDALAADPPVEPFIAFVDGDPGAGNTERLLAKLGGLGRVARIDVDNPVISAFAVTSFPTLLHTHSGVVTASGSRLSHFADTPSLVA
jgi:hypothetical protein